MRHRLLCGGSVGLDQIQSIRRYRLIDRPGNSRDRTRDRGKRVVADLKDGGVVILGDNETMSITSRVNVHESKRVIILQKLETWHLPGNDLAENAVGICFHLCSRNSKASLGPVVTMRSRSLGRRVPNPGYEPHPSCGDCPLTARSRPKRAAKISRKIIAGQQWLSGWWKR